MPKSLQNNKLLYIALITFGAFMIILAVSQPGVTESASPYSAVRLPENYRETLAHYATVQRSDGTIRDIYTTHNAVDHLRTGRYTLPDGTIIVIEGYYAQTDTGGEYMTDSQGHYVKGEPFEMIHVLEKRGNWQTADFAVENRIGQWNFGSFQSDGQHFDEEMSTCFNCHNATTQTDFLYSYRLLSQYAQTGEPQYLSCNLPDRIAC